MTATPTPNIPLLRKAVGWVEEQAARPVQEREWYQGAWVTPAATLGRSCGTCYCVAGYIAQSLEPAFARDHVAVIGRVRVHAADYAESALGLTEDQATALFAASNTARAVRRIAEEIAGEAL